MCGDCWNAAMAAPTAAVAARFAWVGYRDRLPFPKRKTDTRGQTPCVEDGEAELVEVGAPPPP